MQPTSSTDPLTVIQTPRLILRRWVESDLDPFAVMNADARVMEFYPAMLTRVESDELAGRIRRHFDEHGYGLWAAEVPSATLFAGFIGLKYTQFEAHFTPCVEIGWRLTAEYWGRGYATEGAAAVLRYAFESLGLEEVVSMTAEINHRSRRVMEKIGMTHTREDDFEHPLVCEGDRLRRHVLYRAGGCGRLTHRVEQILIRRSKLISSHSANFGPEFRITLLSWRLGFLVR